MTSTACLASRSSKAGEHTGLHVAAIRCVALNKSGRHGMFCDQGRSHLQYMKCGQYSLAHAVLSASETAMLHACVNFRAHTCDAMGCAHLQVGHARHTCYMLTVACSRKPVIDQELHTSLLWSQPDTPLLLSMRCRHCGCCSWLSRLSSLRRHSALQHTSPTDQQTCFTAFRLEDCDCQWKRSEILQHVHRGL